MKIPIIVIAYNRDESLKRLLNNLALANYDNNIVELIISIDKSNNENVYKIAEEFHWQFGEKNIIKHATNLGLRKHILTCGDIALENDAVIMLEDDLFLSESFYKYALQTVEFYNNNQSIAGISLYTYKITEFSNLRPFIPLQDESDTYFVQVPSSWGQIWTRNQWYDFKEWYENKKYENVKFEGLVPDYVLGWKETSWKKYFHMYLAQKNKFFVYPRVALSTNMGDRGTHTVTTHNSHQAVLMSGFKTKYRLKSLDDPTAIKYDPFFENINLIYSLEKHKIDCVIDYYGLKDKFISNGSILSVKNLNYAIIKSWDLALVPYELNIINNIKGDGIYLYDLSKKQKNKNKSYFLGLIKYEIPYVTKEKAFIVLKNDYIQAIKNKIKKIFK